MAFFTSDDINQLTGDDTGAELFDAWFQTGMALLNSLTCNAIILEATGTNLGIVQDNGTTVLLSAWFSKITAVSDNLGNPLEYTFTPTVGDVPTDDTTLPVYGKTLELKDSQPVGTVVNVTGTYGFQTLPDSLKTTLSMLIIGYNDMQTGDSRITHKQIDDVDVTLSDSTQTTLQMAQQLQQPIIDKWSLCQGDSYGDLAYPEKLPNPPYWIGEDYAPYNC